MCIKNKIEALGARFKGRVEKQENVVNFLTLGIFALLAICLFSRISIYIFPKDIWWDEIALWNSINSLNFIKLFQVPLANMQSAPLLFVVLNKIIFNCFGDTLLHIRFLSWLASCISVIALWFVCRKINDIYYTFCVLLLFSLCMVPLHYTVEFKQYTLEFLISIILIYSSICDLEKINFNYDILSVRKLLLYSICFLFSTPAILLIAGILVAEVIIVWQRNSLKNIHLRYMTSIFFGIFSLCYYFFFLRHGAQKMQSYWKEFFIPHTWEGFWNYLPNAGANIFYNLFSGPIASSPYWLFAGLIGGTILLWRTKKELFWLFTLPIGVVFLSNFFLYPPGTAWAGRYGTRVLLFAMPYGLLMSGVFYAWGLKKLVALTTVGSTSHRWPMAFFRCAGRTILACALCVLVFTSAWGNANYLYTGQYQGAQIRELVQTFRANSTQDSLDLVYAPTIYPFSYFQKQLGGKKLEVETLPYSFEPLKATLQHLPEKQRILMLFSNYLVQVGEKGLREIEEMFTAQGRIFFKIRAKYAVLYMLPEKQ